MIIESQTSKEIVMRVNTGGYLSANEVIGREEFISYLWQVLDKQSVVLTSERRIGKSSIINKLKEEEPEGWLIIKRDVEGISTTKEFVTRLVDDLSAHQTKFSQGVGWLSKIRKELDDWKILGVTIAKREEQNWTEKLESILGFLADEQSKNDIRVLLVWDEFPWMLQKIIRGEGAESAANLLDNLRQCRQSQQGIRMMLTGSIGLHHVIKLLQKDSLTNEPLNDTLTVSLPPLTEENAIILAEKLINGEELKFERKSILNALVTKLDCVPYYIHHLISHHKQQNLLISATSIENTIAHAYTSANDPWHLAHYYERLSDYYASDASLYALILDEFAYSNSPLPRKELQSRLAANAALDKNQRKQVTDNDFVRHALRLLSADHYLIQNADTGNYDFSFQLIKAWWRIYRG